MDGLRALEWFNMDHTGHSVAASAFGLRTFYMIRKCGDEWSLFSPGSHAYVETPGYQTQAGAKNAAAVDHERRVKAELPTLTRDREDVAVLYKENQSLHDQVIELQRALSEVM